MGNNNGSEKPETATSGDSCTSAKSASVMSDKEETGEQVMKKQRTEEPISSNGTSFTDTLASDEDKTVLSLALPPSALIAAAAAPVHAPASFPSASASATPPVADATRSTIAGSKRADETVKQTLVCVAFHMGSGCNQECSIMDKDALRFFWNKDSFGSPPEFTHGRLPLLTLEEAKAKVQPLLKVTGRSERDTRVTTQIMNEFREEVKKGEKMTRPKPTIFSMAGGAYHNLDVVKIDEADDMLDSMVLVLRDKEGQKFREWLDNEYGEPYSRAWTVNDDDTLGLHPRFYSRPYLDQNQEEFDLLFDMCESDHIGPPGTR